MESDTDAIKTYQDLGFDVIPIDCSNLIKSRGAVHCMTKTYR